MINTALFLLLIYFSIMSQCLNKYTRELMARGNVAKISMIMCVFCGKLRHPLQTCTAIL